MMNYDLHVHSNASDGTLSPADLVIGAANAGLKGIALTDHDTVAGLEPAMNMIRKRQLELEFIPGIEMNCEYEEQEIHILGYLIDWEHPVLLQRLKEIRELRRKRAKKMVDKLHSMGIPIEFESVQQVARGELIGRPHIARCLIELGYAQSISEVFEQYLGQGRPAYVPRYKFLPKEAIGLITMADGIPVLAHPGLIREQHYVDLAIDWGIKGIEVYYPQHSQHEIKSYHELAVRQGLLITGGSDFHGPGSSESRSRLGAAGVDLGEIQALIKYHIPC